MKKLFYLLFLGLILFSCSNNDEPNDDEIEEKWILVRAEYLNEINELKTVDYSNKNITFKFLTTGVLIIDGGDNIGYNPGEYDYHFFKEYFNGVQMMTFVDINNDRYLHSFNNGIIKLDSDDGIDLFFENK
jgi:hypothetical protein